MTRALQIKLLAAILGVLALLAAVYLRNSRRDHAPVVVIGEKEKELQKKLAQKPPATYQEP
jgi:hypothetical protein